MIRVDVVIPTYHETDRLFAAVESARRQTHTIRRTIVLDDGSSAQIKEHLEQTLVAIPNVDFFSLGHSGHPGVVRREGVEKSEADWIAFLDADDTWEDDKIFMQLDLAEQLDAGLVYSNAWISGQQSRARYFSTKNRMPKRINTLRLLFSNPIINSSVIVRREHLQRVGGYATSQEVRGVEDYATWLRLSTISRLVGIEEPLLTYSVSETSFSRRSVDIAPSAAIRDFRRWLVGANLPNWKKVTYKCMASAVLAYRRSRHAVSAVLRRPSN